MFGKLFQLEALICLSKVHKDDPSDPHSCFTAGKDTKGREAKGQRRGGGITPATNTWIRHWGCIQVTVVYMVTML